MNWARKESTKMRSPGLLPVNRRLEKKKKTMCNLKAENYVLSRGLTGDVSLGCSHSGSSKGLYQRGKGGARMYRRFLMGGKTQNFKNMYLKSKRLLLIIKTHIKLTISVLFCVWEGASVWAY